MARPLAELPFPALSDLLRTRTPATFFDEWWEKSPGLLRAGPEAARAEFLRSDWRGLAASSIESGGATVEVIRAGGRPGGISLEFVDQAFREGASVRILRVQKVWPFLDSFCRALQSELGFRVSANLYVTPEGRQGLDVHADSHDVFVVQMAGRKDWDLFGSPYPLPLDFHPPLIFEELRKRDHHGDGFGARSYKGEDIGGPLVQCSLSPGDLLYIPRGFVHQAVASHGTSVHVTIGVHATTWADLLSLAVAQEARNEAGLRETLPPGAMRVAASGEYVEAELRQRGARLMERMMGDALMLEAAARFAAATSSSGPAPVETDSDSPAHHGEGAAAEDASKASSEGVAFDPSRPYRLAPDAYVSFRPEVIDVRSLRAVGAVLGFHPSLKPVFDQLLAGGAISGASLGPMTPRSGEVFLSRLVRTGVLISA